MNEEHEYYQHRLTALEMIEHNKPLREHWIRRFIAVFIDLIIVLIPAIIIGLPLGIKVDLFSLLLNPFLALFWVFYSAIMEFIYGYTIGKMAMCLRVQSLKGPFDFYKAILRNLSKVHGTVLFLDLIVGMLTVGDPRQRFLDRIAETTVVGAPHHHRPRAHGIQGGDAPLPRPLEHESQGNP